MTDAWMPISEAPDSLPVGAQPLLVKKAPDAYWVWTDAAAYSRQTWIDMGATHFLDIGELIQDASERDHFMRAAFVDLGTGKEAWKERAERAEAALERRDELLTLVFRACATKGQSRAAHRKACIARDKAAGEWMARNESLLRRKAKRLKPSDGAIYAAASAKNLSDQRLSELIEAARHHVMTPEEKRLQRRYWVIGEMGIEHPEMTREEIERIVDEVLY